MNSIKESIESNNKFRFLEKVTTSFGYFIPLLFRNIPIKIQTPILNISSKLKSESNNTLSLNFSNYENNNTSEGFFTFIDSIEEIVQDYLLEKNILEYIPFVLQKNNYYRFKLPINYKDKKCNFNCYDHNKGIIDLSNDVIYDYLRNDTQVKLIIKCYGIYYQESNQKYGLLWKIEQMKILPFERNITNYFDDISTEFENYSIIGNEEMLNSIKNLSDTLDTESK